MNRTTLLVVGLFVSLALNVFVVGAFVGARLVDREPAPRPAAPGPRNPVAAALSTLPPETQAQWREEMPQYAQTYGPKMREARRLARETMRGFGAEPFDQAKAIENLGRARALEFESRQGMDRRLVEFAAGLPQDERARFGEALARPPLGRGGARPGDGARPGLPER